MSSKELIKAFEEAGIPCETIIIKETEADKKRHKEIEKFLQDLEDWRNQPLPNMVFK